MLTLLGSLESLVPPGWVLSERLLVPAAELWHKGHSYSFCHNICSYFFAGTGFLDCTTATQAFDSIMQDHGSWIHATYVCILAKLLAKVIEAHLL